MNRILVLMICGLMFSLGGAQAAYHHAGETDSDKVLGVYPALSGTKLDSCALCHTGGQYEKKPGVFVELGSCQWCHYSYGYDGSGDIAETLNNYGSDYRAFGQDPEALQAIETRDSDIDGFTNKEEIVALRYPGNSNDDPTKVAAPFRVVSRTELLNMTVHNQIMLMNTHKSGDFYAEYTGIPMAELLEDSGILDSATGISVFAPDGWAQYHPLEYDEDPVLYHVYGLYPEAQYYYREAADETVDPAGWCMYPLSAVDGLSPDQTIKVDGGLQMILAYARDGKELEPGQLTLANKLDGEGPFRVVPPQKLPGPPDQPSTSPDNGDIWGFDPDADHNAGFSSRSATVIRVEPLPDGTTDVDLLEAGWNYVDEEKILIYGAIDPKDTVRSRLGTLEETLNLLDKSVFQPRSAKRTMLQKLSVIKRHLGKRNLRSVFVQLEMLQGKVDGCVLTGAVEKNDWINSCTDQNIIYWALNELEVLLSIDN